MHLFGLCATRPTRVIIHVLSAGHGVYVLVGTRPFERSNTQGPCVHKTGGTPGDGRLIKSRRVSFFTRTGDGRARNTRATVPYNGHAVYTQSITTLRDCIVSRTGPNGGGGRKRGFRKRSSVSRRCRRLMTVLVRSTMRFASDQTLLQHTRTLGRPTLGTDGSGETRDVNRPGCYVPLMFNDTVADKKSCVCVCV